ncbi:MAG: UDP-N-acetylmuramoyl-tripeptide--D-alanyl-D-alanine ligase [Gammaproteobacteria bacterium]|nr:UDP-N-acetylmuramoyl-tripeptide--D-alanyl-D-alanine ligase [Gammaproteobacteria bacterium]
MRIALREVASVVGAAGVVEGDAAAGGWSTDTRTIRPGDVFFALRGPNHDGNRYAATALERGAAAVVVDGEVATPGTRLRVDDALRALQDLARWARVRWGGTVVGITGSAGKTTTKDVIAQMLGSAMTVGKTGGNYNNHVGVPLSILGVPDDARAAVIELGMNHAGEIRALATIAKPEIALVTNVGYAHVENFDRGIEGIALAKRELVEALPAAGGVAVLNADDERVARFAAAHAGRVVTFGLSEGAVFRATRVEPFEGGMRFVAGGVEFESPLAGLHNVRNVLAGLAVAGLFGIDPQRLRDVVRTLSTGAMRGERLVRDGVTIYNDCYNANPEAMRAMIDVLRRAPARRRIAVLGEMLELGSLAESLHREVGRYAGQAGIDVVIGVRGAARHLVDAAVEAGVARESAHFFEDPVEAGEQLKRIAVAGDVILLKGSRGTRVERSLEQYLA